MTFYTKSTLRTILLKPYNENLIEVSMESFKKFLII